LNRLSEDFGKHFIPQQELFAEQAFWLQTSNPNTDQFDISPVKIKAPREVPKVILVNTSLKKLKYHLGQFDTVVKSGLHLMLLQKGNVDLLNEVTEVQIVFNQMEAAVQQCAVDKQCFEIHKKELFLENDRLLHQIMSQDVMICVMNSTAVYDDVNLEMKKSESCNKCLDLDAELLNKQNAYNDLSKSYLQLEKHCISLESTMKLNQQNFQMDTSSDHKNALEIPEYFEYNDLKAQLQAKDTTICKLKEHIKSIRENNKEKKVKQEMDEIETINIELEHNQFDSIKKTRALSKEHYDSLIAQLNSKSMEKADLKGMFKLDLDSLAPRLLKNRDAHIDYLKYTQEQADILWEIVVQIILWYLDSECSKHMTGNRSQLMNFVNKFLGTIRFGNDHIVKIIGYGDNQLGNVTISRVYYVKGLGHNLFSVGQLCDSDLEVAFRKNTCFIWNLDGVDLLSGSTDTNLYTISLDDMLMTSSICLLSKALKTKSWLWHRRLSHLNFGTLNKLAKDGLIRGIPKIKFKKDHLCQSNQYSLLYPKSFPNPSLIQQNSYELIHNKKPDLSFLHVFGSLRYPTNDSDDLGKLNAKADIGLVLNLIPQQPCNPPTRNDWDHLFQPMFDEFQSSTSVVSPIQVAATPRAVDLPDSPVTTSIDQDALSTSIPSTQKQEQE
ncbi:integrase, catalytic region, zinc finger, CCHC-type containing protein, partial [Tanacetum coccineum]